MNRLQVLCARVPRSSVWRSSRLPVPSFLQRLSTEEGKEQAMEEKLQKALSATAVTVKDISGGCGAMYSVEVVSPEFAGKKLVEQHKMVTEVLKEDISDMHGLTLKTKSK